MLNMLVMRIMLEKGHDRVIAICPDKSSDHVNFTTVKVILRSSFLIA